MKKILLTAALLLTLAACSHPVKITACDGKPYPECNGLRVGEPPNSLNSNLAISTFPRNKELFPTVSEYEASPSGKASMDAVGAKNWDQEAALRGLPNNKDK